MTNLERAQNILRLADKCTGGPCGKCEIDLLCNHAMNLLVLSESYKNINDEDFAVIVNKLDAKWR